MIGEPVPDPHRQDGDRSRRLLPEGGDVALPVRGPALAEELLDGGAERLGNGEGSLHVRRVAARLDRADLGPGQPARERELGLRQAQGLPAISDAVPHVIGF